MARLECGNVGLYVGGGLMKTATLARQIAIGTLAGVLSTLAVEWVRGQWRRSQRGQ